MSALLSFCLSILLFTSCGSGKLNSDTDPPAHNAWTALLQEHVGPDGLVDYKGFLQDSASLDAYLNDLSAHPPGSNWSSDERKAYWINAYNAFTVRLILDHYPVASIKDIKKGIPFVNSVWDIKFIKIGDETFDLNNIEHGILRKDFDDPRIHAAINCASLSCPVLRNAAYEPKNLDAQLDTAMRTFLNDNTRNRINADYAELSQIFNWFSGDFKDAKGSVREYVNAYADTPVAKDAKISFLDYNWSLNER